ncbi:hypothetical protein [Sulfurospirillum sp.]|uniref:hypothetical protein n=1 Tax=Sulfurospirillum sp. TaxID=2053622 RepID=UPI002FDD8739
MYKIEIARRLNKSDYTRLPKLLGINLAFENVISESDFKKILRIADVNGSKYIELYKVKDNIDISSLISNLKNKSYAPNIPSKLGQNSLEIAEISITTSGFDILSNFYVAEEVWELSSDGKTKTLNTALFRKVLHLKFLIDKNLLILTIDPIGDGAKIAEDIKIYLRTVFSNIGINFNDYFIILDIDNAIYSMVEKGIIRPTRTKAIDQISKRTYDTIAQNPKDSLADEDLYTQVKEKKINLERMRLDHDKSKIRLELFSTDLIKIWNKANWEQTDEFKADIIRFL